MAQAPAESKVILLTEASLTDQELKTVSENLIALVFQPKLHSSQNIDVILRSCRMVIVNINDADSRRWYSQQRGIVAANRDWSVVYKLAKGHKTETDTIANIKQTFGCRVVMKYLPEGVRDAAVFIARLLSDHLPSNESLCSKITKCVLG